MTDHKTRLIADPLRAPWTAEQVETLNRYQASGLMHPYTCPNWHGEPVERRNLLATEAGWTCRHCDYKQDWAHDHHFKAEATE
jgi:hypothetical protein